MTERHPDGYLRETREPIPARDPQERRKDYAEIYAPSWDEEQLKAQGERCMDCGIPACMAGCPLGNRIPEWNDLVSSADWKTALERLHATNNFPEFTGYTCPAPCEPACTLAITNEAVTIKSIERAIVDKGWEMEWIRPEPPQHRSGKRVAVVGSGPAGLAAAQQLNRVGHEVVVYERDELPGGLMMFGIPDFKFAKHRVDKRIRQLEAEGIRFLTSVNVGEDVALAELEAEYDAVLLAIGAQQHRDVPLEGRDLDGVVFGMEYLTQENRRQAGIEIHGSNLTAKDKPVVVLGGGDTGADCVATAHRQGASAVRQFSINPELPEERPADNPWPEYPETRQESYALAEGGEPRFSLDTLGFRDTNGDGKVDLVLAEKVEWKRENGKRVDKTVIEPDIEIPAELVLIAIGFNGAEIAPFADTGLEIAPNGCVAVNERMQTNHEKVFCAGDASRGASLVVWAIAAGREVAREMDRYLMGESRLPTSIRTSNPPLGALDVDL